MERMIADVCKETGTRPLVDPDYVPPLENFPMTEPSKGERAVRKALHRMAKAALVLSKDSSPLCKSVLKTLAAFAAGKGGYLDLALARQRLSNRTDSAGAIGLRHRAPNAAATIACFHACHPDIKEAEQLTRQFCAMTAEFANDPGRIPCLPSRLPKKPPHE